MNRRSLIQLAGVIPIALSTGCSNIAKAPFDFLSELGRYEDWREQRAGRMNKYEEVSEDELIKRISSINEPILVKGCYTALVGEEDYFINGEKFLENSNFLKFADNLSISTGIDKKIISKNKKEEYIRERMKKTSIKWHIPGDKSFFSMHAGGPGYDPASNQFIDIYNIFDRVQISYS